LICPAADKMPIKQLQQFFRGINPRVMWNEDKTGIVKQEKHEDESWTALYIDLVYVAMYINVGFVLRDCGSNTEAIQDALMIFLIMFMSRYSMYKFS
jgi:hypothetical protein